MTNKQVFIMTAHDVLEIYSELKLRSVEIWLDGGWGVDALLGKNTRTHSDFDIVIQKKDLLKLKKYLNKQGFRDVERDDTRAWNFVLGDNQGKFIDVHAIEKDGKGNGIYGPVEQGVFYPASSLTGLGEINGQLVQCLTAEYQVESHSGYQLKEKDFWDVTALCQKFGIPLPKEFKISKKKLYQCPACKLHYKNKIWAEKCEAWCKEHSSCNIAITAHAEETK